MRLELGSLRLLALVLVLAMLGRASVLLSRLTTTSILHVSVIDDHN